MENHVRLAGEGSLDCTRVSAKGSIRGGDTVAAYVPFPANNVASSVLIFLLSTFFFFFLKFNFSVEGWFFWGLVICRGMMSSLPIMGAFIICSP